VAVVGVVCRGCAWWCVVLLCVCVSGANGADDVAVCVAVCVWCWLVFKGCLLVIAVCC